MRSVTLPVRHYRWANSCFSYIKYIIVEVPKFWHNTHIHTQGHEKVRHMQIRLPYKAILGYNVGEGDDPGHHLPLHHNLDLCCMDTATLKWTRHADTWKILKNTHDTCVGHVCGMTHLHDNLIRVSVLHRLR